MVGLGGDYESIVVNITTRIETLPLQEVYSLIFNDQNRQEQLNSALSIEVQDNINMVANYSHFN